MPLGGNKGYMGVPGMELTLQGRLTTGQEALDTDLRDLQIITGPEGPFLYATTGQNGGLSAFRLSQTGGMATLTDTALFTGVSAGASIGGLSDVMLDGAAQLVFGGGSSGQIVSYELQSNGQLGALSQTELSGSDARILTSCAMILESGQTVIYALEQGRDALVIHADDGSESETNNVYTIQSDGTFQAEGALMQTVTMGDATSTAHLLLVADAGTQGLSSYRIDPTSGAVQAADSLGAAQGVGLNTPTVLETLDAYGETWVLLGAAGSQSLSVMQLDQDGSLTLTDHLLDTRNTRFGGIQALDTVVVQGQVFVVAGGSDDGLTLFSLLPDGRLVHRLSLAHDTGLGLENITAIEAVSTGDEIQIFVTSGTTPGLSQFTMPLDTLGLALHGSGTLTGGAGDDQIIATGTGSATLRGAGGDDLLVAGDGGATLTGGAGADLFVLRPVTASVKITDFEPGVDQLDLSLFAMLRDPGQLQMTETSTGAQIEFGTTRIVINSRSGQSLDSAQIWSTGFTSPDRLMFDPAPPQQVLQGSAAGEYIEGGAGHDMVYAEGGPDRVWSGAGDDVVFGGAGDDTLGTGDGADSVLAGAGNDSVTSADGNDTVNGEAGLDTLWGGAGDDDLRGGDDNDTVGGSIGNDTLRGDAGFDLIYGDIGDDVLYGGADNDKLWAGVDQDMVWGGDGYDTLGGGDGDDTLHGEIGNDLIYGGDDAGADLLSGGAGADTIWPGPGPDDVSGDAGNDTVGGGVGTDTVRGGAGNDRVWGGTEDDLLYGDAGRDTLTGEAGNDIFVFQSDHGDDLITDFTLGQDSIHIDIAGLSYGDLHIRSTGPDTTIDTGSGSIKVQSLLPWDLSADDFLFG